MKSRIKWHIQKTSRPRDGALCGTDNPMLTKSKGKGNFFPTHPTCYRCQEIFRKSIAINGAK